MRFPHEDEIQAWTESIIERMHGEDKDVIVSILRQVRQRPAIFERLIDDLSNTDCNLYDRFDSTAFAILQTEDLFTPDQIRRLLEDIQSKLDRLDFDYGFQPKDRHNYCSLCFKHYQGSAALSMIRSAGFPHLLDTKDCKKLIGLWLQSFPIHNLHTLGGEELWRSWKYIEKATANLADEDLWDEWSSQYEEIVASRWCNSRNAARTQLAQLKKMQDELSEFTEIFRSCRVRSVIRICEQAIEDGQATASEELALLAEVKGDVDQDVLSDAWSELFQALSQKKG